MLLRLLCVCFFILPIAASGSGQAFVFPGARGFGVHTPAGRGGKVIRVTNLNSQGAGSFRAALEQEGARIVCFEVGGVINLAKNNLLVTEPFLTVAGQTAPSPGITLIRGGMDIETHDVLIRHIRVRPGDAEQPKKSGWEPDGIATSGPSAYNIVIDHCSISWAVDENLSASGPRLQGPAATSHDITFSNCIIAEGLSDSAHAKGPHSKGSLIHDNCTNIAIIANLYAHNVERNPYFKACTTGVIVNNLIYNPGGHAIKVRYSAGEWRESKTRRPENARLSIVGNVMVHGANTMKALPLVGRAGGKGQGDLYLEDNIAKLRSGEDAGIFVEPYRILDEKPVWPERLTALPASKTAEYVLRHAGARPRDRDAVDRRIVGSFRERTGKIIDSQTEVGGYPRMTPTRRKLKIPEKNLDEWLAALASDLYPLYASAAQEPVSFANAGQIKMLYDRRQRPASVYLDKKVHIVFNAKGEPGAEPKAPTKPMAVTYDPAAREFSEIVTLGPGDRDHHYGPVIWADDDGYLHVLYGCHKTPGTHLISKQPGSIGSSLDSWDVAPQIAPGISYPTVYSIYDNQELIYYRTDGHPSSWTYRISDDNGRSWTGPENDVTDLDINGALDWSSYQSKSVSKDGRFLHVAFVTFDDNKADDPARFYNPRYNQAANMKYNLYYIRINLQTEEVVNADGETLQTPIDLALANSKCMIWDTEWRGSGVPPTILLDENDEPGFVHVISEETLEDHRYYYVRRENGQWKQTPVIRTSNEWNAAHLTRDKGGTLHAFLIAGDYFDSDGYMDKHGGGTIEEWISSDNGNLWALHRDLTPDTSKYPGWRYNNIQPVTKSDGSNVDNMLLFYGWVDLNAPEAEAFLLHNDTAWYDVGDVN